jgi:hypothetical protein
MMVDKELTCSAIRNSGIEVLKLGIFNDDIRIQWLIHKGAIFI